MLKNASVQSKIFVSYSVLIAAIIGTLTVFLSLYIGGFVKEKAISNMEQRVQKSASQLEYLYKEMDVLSTQVVFSQTLQTILLNALNSGTKDKNYFHQNIEDAQQARQVLVSINSPKVIARKISVFNGESNFISAGVVSEDQRAIAQSMRNDKLIDQILSLKGRALLLSPHPDNWLDNAPDPLVVSLARSILYTAASESFPLGIVEIQQPYSKFSDIFRSETQSGRFLVMYKTGELIYPADGSVKIGDAEYYYRQTAEFKNRNSLHALNPDTQTDELVYYLTSGSSGLTVMLIQSEAELLEPVYFIRKMIVLSGIALVGLTLLAIHFITVSIVNPLRKLRNSVNQVTIDNLSMDAHQNIGNNELVQLKEAFDRMLLRLKESIHQTVQSRNSEVHAHFLALQAQMNPHFLYNTLMGIHAMAHEAGSREISNMCIELSEMLRYTGSFSHDTVTLGDELNHAENYLKLYKWRYEDKLSYEFHVDPAMLGLTVPKLVIQPIVENCFAHGFNRMKTARKIIIEGSVAAERFVVEIRDNGSGIEEDRVREIKSRLAEYETAMREGRMNGLNVGGLGLANIYIRLKLLYGDKAVFDIRNHPDGGVAVSIGGDSGMEKGVLEA